MNTISIWFLVTKWLVNVIFVIKYTCTYTKIYKFTILCRKLWKLPIVQVNSFEISKNSKRVT